MSDNMLLATAAWLFLAYGFCRRTAVPVHVTCQLSGIALDLAIVVHLTLTRSALERALQPDLNFLHQLHILTSLLAVILYIPVLILGFWLLVDRAARKVRAWHRVIATTALLLRSAGFLLMFSLL